MSTTTIQPAPRRAVAPAPEAAENAPQHPWYALPPADALATLGSSEDGLTDEAAAERLARSGPNALPQPQGEHPLRLLWRQVNNPLIGILIASGLLALALGKGTDGLVVLGVVALNALVGFVQEYRAGRAIRALDDLVSDTATALRGGHLRAVPAADLVPGDVIRLEAGDRVPADARVLRARGLAVEEAMLTGEPVPAQKRPDPVEAGAPLGDRVSMLYSGTMVTAGSGTAVVVATGWETELGKISEMLAEVRHVETPLMRQLDRVGGALTVGIGAVSAALFGVALLRGYPAVDAVLAAITLAVAAIPEGLPAIITIALAIGVQRMARRRAVVRQLPAVETLGGTTVICSDKTGTLTRGEMTVRALWTPRGRYALTGAGYAPEGALLTEEVREPLRPVPLPIRGDGASREAELSRDPEDARALLLAGALCSDAALEQKHGAWTIAGDPTEGALVVAAQKRGLDAEAERRRWPRLDAIPFASERQYMATLHAHPEGGQVVLVKGAPEVVAARCGEDADAMLAEAHRLAGEGMRVLALAARVPETPLDGLGEDDVAGGLTLLGLQAMADPPRPEAVEAVGACRRAGVAVKMITGDHRATAAAIGRQLGLRADAPLTGPELAALDDDALLDAAQATDVFARVAPEQKLRLVEALQRRGAVVAMTGDGVNDAPALKRADIGVAMGVTGTAAAKEAAALVLTDDNFASITAAVEEGRRVYDNLVKSLAFLLPTNIGEALIILVAVAFFPVVGGAALLPMLPVQILWINLVATVTLALPLAFEARERDVMARAPRDPAAPILDRFLMARTVGVAVLMTIAAVALFLFEYGRALDLGAPDALAQAQGQTVAVTTVVLFQIVYLFQCRSLRGPAWRLGLASNPWVYAGAALLLAFQAAFVYLPAMHALFGSAPIGADEWGRALAAALVVWPAVALEKRWGRRRA